MIVRDALELTLISMKSNIQKVRAAFLQETLSAPSFRGSANSTLRSRPHVMVEALKVLAHLRTFGRGVVFSALHD